MQSELSERQNLVPSASVPVLLDVALPGLKSLFCSITVAEEYSKFHKELHTQKCLNFLFLCKTLGIWNK